MGPKKETKKGAGKNDIGAPLYNLDDPINTDTWKCVVVMAVERTYFDGFILKEFAKESLSKRRQEVSLIDFDTFVVEILNAFASEELPYKYGFLLNFATVFQEAATYLTQKIELPIFVLVRVVKALLFYLREESLAKIKRMGEGLSDPIKAMAERGTNPEVVDSKKKEISKKGNSRLKLKPPSAIKEDTELLKRGEGAKYDKCIDDAPLNGYFNHYVLLTGFYKPDFPLELIKAGIPLHGLLCIDTSALKIKQDSFSSFSKFQKRVETKSQEIDNFWAVFLKMLWNPSATFYFKDTIFQVYMPSVLLCNKNKLREFIYREISFLMYDLSDLKRQLNNYLDHMRLWSVSMKELGIFEAPFGFDNFPNECISVPVVLQYIIDAVCEVDKNVQQGLSPKTESSTEEVVSKCLTPSVKSKVESCTGERLWSQELEKRKEFNLLKAYLKTKELDEKYDVYDAYDNSSSPGDSTKTSTEIDSTEVLCAFTPQECGKNMEEALLMADNAFGSFWKKYEKHLETTYRIDFCLYSLLMTRVFCHYQTKAETSPARSSSTIKKNSDFGVIGKVNPEMLKLRFTVTEGSRSILRCIPCNFKNISRDFFCPAEFKIVSLEKLKASSAPEFRITPSFRIKTLYPSEIIKGEISKNPFESLRGFIDECLFSNTNNFDLVEFLSKPKLLEKELEYWIRYNCVDHAYSFLDDSIFLVLHNRKDEQNLHHETFNEGLKTAVGLRDFYEYVVEDEAEWLKAQEELHKIAVFLANKMLESDSFRNFSESEFWLAESLKHQTHGVQNFDFDKEVKTEPSVMEKLMYKIKVKPLNKESNKDDFEGYEVSDMAIQFSGLKTVYYSNDCNVAVQLIEMLYGNQELGIHVTATAHTLHLYSYVCPEPHIADPFTFHLSYKNGIVVAFSRRCVEIKKKSESGTLYEVFMSGLRSGFESRLMSISTMPEIQTQVSEPESLKEYFYDMAVSLPNGLSIQTIRNIVQPFYIKQQYLGKNEEIAKLEDSRLFLPNGNVVKMMADGTVEILKMDTSIVTAKLSDLIHERDSGNSKLTNFTVISGEGYERVFEEGKITSTKRLQIFQNTNLETNQVYFRRRDGTNYMLQNNGTLCVQFRDGTRMSTSIMEKIIQKEVKKGVDSFLEEENAQEAEPEDDFVFVYLEIITEHPDYATVIYNSLTQEWKILLPYDSKIALGSDEHYSVEIDQRTEFKLQADHLIQLESFSEDRQLQNTFTADLSVFDNKEATIYCRMTDSTGKTFTVEKNSNHYIVEGETPPQEHQNSVKLCEESQSQESEESKLVALMDLQTCLPTQTKTGTTLSRENKYFVIRRDMTGMELLHRDDVNKELNANRKGSLVYTLNIPEKETRCFVQITPKQRKKLKKWEVETILPDPKYQPKPSPKTTSSTYGVPPSWMHPFPKKKAKFVVPELLACRVFVETKKTDLSPKIGNFENLSCEIEETNQQSYLNIPPKGVEEFLRKLSNDDQNMLKEMYTLAVASLIQEKKNSKPVNSEKLQHYLEMSKYWVELREYHKKCIRYNIVPNYFHHPAGMSWLILNDLLFTLKFADKRIEVEVPAKEAALWRTKEVTSEDQASEFSNEEIEYNLSVSAGQSFSDLSCRSDLSAQTAPAILRTGGIHRCKVRPLGHPSSSPVIKFISQKQDYEESLKESEIRVCSFQEKDIEKIEMKGYEEGKTLWVSLEDLMHLGLV